MRLGVIADVHGNVHALEAVLAAVSRLGVDGWLCAGDLVGYGPRPNECVERVAALPGVVVVAGNHDLMAVGRLPVPDGLGPLPRRTLEWTWGELDEGARSYLEGLPVLAEAADGAVAVAHGSLDDPLSYVADRAAGCAQLRLLRERSPRARTLVLGHTHHPLSCSLDGGPALYNPGSVGQSRERRPVARGLVLDLAGPGASADWVTVDYDVRATRRELQAAGLPPHACHLAPGRRARLKRRLAVALG
jgi:predicted phosphodiesterase